MTAVGEEAPRPSVSGFLAGFRRSSRARHTIALGAMLATMGIGIAGSSSRLVGGTLLVAGWLVLAAGIHSFGRRGTS